MSLLYDLSWNVPAEKDFHLAFVPRISHLCLKKLEELGVKGSVSVVEEFSMDLLPLDCDVMSMEADAAFKVQKGGGHSLVGQDILAQDVVALEGG